MLARSSSRGSNPGERQKPGALRRELDCLLAEAPVQHRGPDLEHTVCASRRRECQKPGKLRRKLDCLVAQASVQHCGPDLEHAMGAAGRPAHLPALVHACVHQLIDGALDP